MNAAFTRFGSYALGQPIAEHPEAKEETLLDRVRAAATVKTDEALKVWGETRYHTSEWIEFLGGSWLIRIGVSEGRICKLTICWQGKLQAPMVAMHVEAMKYCRARLGENMSGSKETGLTWKTDFGTVVLTAGFVIQNNTGNSNDLIADLIWPGKIKSVYERYTIQIETTAQLESDFFKKP